MRNLRVLMAAGWAFDDAVRAVGCGVTVREDINKALKDYAQENLGVH